VAGRVLNGPVRIERIDPADLDLDTADAMAEIGTASLAAAGLSLPPPAGPGLMLQLQVGSEGHAEDGLWLAYDGQQLVAFATLHLPDRQNTDSARLSATVHPDHRRRGVGSALLGEGVAAAAAAGRTKLFAGAFAGSDGIPALSAMGWQPIARDARSGGSRSTTATGLAGGHSSRRRPRPPPTTGSSGGPAAPRPRRLTAWSPCTRR
jgi:GNAT superfamily N-acetyltransferase